MKRKIQAVALALASLLITTPTAEAVPGKRGGKTSGLRRTFKEAAKKRASGPFYKASTGDKSGAMGRSNRLPGPRVDGSSKKNKNKPLPGPK